MSEPASVEHSGHDHAHHDDHHEPTFADIWLPYRKNHDRQPTID